MKIKKFNESKTETVKSEVFIEPIASASDFYNYIEENEDYFDISREEFHDEMLEFIWSEGILSSRYNKEWCQKVIDGKAGKYWEKAKHYYPIILKFMEDYNLETIRFVIDW